MGLANLVASWSEDTSRKVGAVIVGSGNAVLSTGYNGFPRGVNAHAPERHSRIDGEKYHWFEHAERNAIFNAARNGIKIEGSTLYCTSFPCSNCMSAIIQSGCIRLVGIEPDLNDLKYSRSFFVSLQMAAESGLRVDYLD
jgi:dCMP deaminase